MPILRWINEYFNLFRIIRTLPEMDTGMIEFPNQIDKASIEDLRFMLKEVQEKNKSLNERADSLYEKSVIFFSIAVTTLSGLVLYIADNNPVFEPKYIISWEIILILISVCSVLKRNLKMAKYHGVGTIPKVFTNESLYPRRQTAGFGL